jgi:hypothetical protein
MKKSKAMKKAMKRIAAAKRAAMEKRAETRKKWREEASHSCLSAESRIVAINPKAKDNVTDGSATSAIGGGRWRDHQLNMPFSGRQRLQEPFPESKPAKPRIPR